MISLQQLHSEQGCFRVLVLKFLRSFYNVYNVEMSIALVSSVYEKPFKNKKNR